MSWVTLRAAKRGSGVAMIAREYSAAATSPTQKSGGAMNVFDRSAKARQRNWSASLTDPRLYDYVRDEVGWRTFDRLCDIKRQFRSAADLGCGRGHVSRHLSRDQELVTESVTMVDSCKKILDQADTPDGLPCEKIVGDEESPPFAPESLDLVYSSLALHWVNNLPGCLHTVYQALRPGGAFVATIMGGDTLYELRSSLQMAEVELRGGFAPSRVSPFVRPEDVSSLLSQAGFKLLTVDVDEIVIGYPGIRELMTDLQGMGESNCSWARTVSLRRDVIERADAIYKKNYGEDGKSVPATFSFVGMIGWRLGPGDEGPKVAPRGSGQVSLKELGNMEEIVNNMTKK